MEEETIQLDQCIVLKSNYQVGRFSSKKYKDQSWIKQNNIFGLYLLIY